jgi:hypothetical protein
MSDSNDPYIHYYSRFSGEYASRLDETIVEGRGLPLFHVEDAVELAQQIHRHGRIWRDFAVFSGMHPVPLRGV